MAGDKQALQDLHDKLAEVLSANLNVKDENGKVNAAVLNVARQFLKDNGIEAKPVKGTHFGDLAGKVEDEFPFQPDTQH